MSSTYIFGGVILLIIISIIVFVFLGSKEEIAQAPATTLVGTLSFMDEFAQTENAMLVDVRTGDEYSSGKIAGAINVDFNSPDFVTKMKALGVDHPFFIYCRSGNRSGRAVDVLTKEGFVVKDLKGGIGAHPELLE